MARLYGLRGIELCPECHRLHAAWTYRTAEEKAARLACPFCDHVVSDTIQANHDRIAQALEHRPLFERPDGARNDWRSDFDGRGLFVPHKGA